jgi:hypothetical protein
MASDPLERVSPGYRGKPFSAIFQAMKGEVAYWRIKGSGVRWVPESCMQTRAVVDAMDDIGIEFKRYHSATPLNPDSFTITASFLDGGFYAMTGNYWFYPRGAYVGGAKAVLLIALHLGLKVRDAWRRKHGLEGVGMNELLAGLNQQDTPAHA